MLTIPIVLNADLPKCSRKGDLDGDVVCGSGERDETSPSHVI